MTRSPSPAAFRASLLTLCKNEARSTGRSADGVQTRLAMERFIARLQELAPDAFVLKGGLDFSG